MSKHRSTTTDVQKNTEIPLDAWRSWNKYTGARRRELTWLGREPVNVIHKVVGFMQMSGQVLMPCTHTRVPGRDSCMVMNCNGWMGVQYP